MNQRPDTPARQLAEWSEDDGDVLWWRFPISEAPYLGTPNDLGHTVELHTQDKLEPRIAARCTIGGWPGYHTHWTPLPPAPQEPPPMVSSTGKPPPDTTQPSQEQVRVMVDVWREWNAQTPGRRPSVDELMRRAYQAAQETLP